MLPDLRLTQRFTLGIVAILVAIIAAFYFYSVPLIKTKVFEIERNASHIALNNVFELANKMQSSSAEYREQILAAHRQRLQAVVETTAFFLASQLEQAAARGADRQQVQAQVLQQIQQLSYSGGDYVWVASEQAQLLAHPDPAYRGRNAKQIVDASGQPVMPSVIDSTLRDGEGFYRYRWPRLNQTQSLEKFSYVKHYPQWGLVIGTGVYIDDIEAEVAARREQALAELRQAFNSIKIAQTGYLFIFDDQGRMLVHPNQNIDGIDFRTLRNPVTGRGIMEDLISVADSGEPLYYQWDRPSDPGNYVYEKVSLVRFLPGYNWYICSSVYLDELQASSKVLADRILLIAFAALLAASALALVFAHLVTRPIRRLSETAHRISSGELHATTAIQRRDEIGVLARAFDRMVDRLRQNILQLDDKVGQRTAELNERNAQLERLMQQVQSAKQNLELLEERQRLILDALPAQVAYIDDQQRYVFVNEGYAQAFGCSKTQIIGRTLEQVVGQRMYRDIQPQVAAALAGTPSSFEYTLSRGNEQRITKRSLIPFTPHGRQVHGLVNLSLDITAEKEAEQRLQAAQRMHSVGQMAGGLAHDFNNLLSILQGNLIALQENPATPAQLLPYIEPAVRATRRGSDITRRLLAFAGRQPLSPTPIDLLSLMRDSLTLIQGSLPSSIQLHTEYDEALWSPLADPGQLEDVLVNLALNARDAMPDGGRLSFSLHNRTLGSGRVLDEPVVPGQYVELCVSDSGRGFSNEAIRRAFEPFYTTRQGANSSGLGLSMVYGFVKQSDGYIALANNLEGGALVTLLLPASPTRSEASTPVTAADRPACDQGGLVLLVDDEDDVRAVIREQLVKLGYAVIESGDSQEALGLIDTLPALTALVSDVVMPGEYSGFQLAQRLSQRQPAARAVLITGFAQRHQPQPELEPGSDSRRRWPLLQKPFSRDQLAEALQQSSDSIRE